MALLYIGLLLQALERSVRYQIVIHEKWKVVTKGFQVRVHERKGGYACFVGSCRASKAREDMSLLRLGKVAFTV